MTTTPPTRWLDDDEMRAWLALVGVTRTLPAALDSALRASAGMTLFDYLVLAMLSQAPERTLTCTQLSRQVDGSLSRLTHTLDRLADHGWVTRDTAPTDRRVTRATLTDAGLHVVKTVAPAHVASVRALVFDALTGEQVGQMEQICAAIADRARTPHDPHT